MFARLRLMPWAAPALLLIAACRNDTNPNPSGTNPNPGAPPSTPTQSSAPSERASTPPNAPPPGATANPATARTPSAADTERPSSATTASAQTAGPLTDGQIAAITDGLNSGEIEQAKLAKSKSKNKDVLSFANMMIEHHGQAKKQQAALKENPEPNPVASQLQTESQQTIAKLNQATGSDFDRAYMDAQVEGHQKALDTLKQKLLPNAKAPELTKYLRDLQPKIEQHLARAKTLRDSVAQNTTSKKEPMNQPASMKQRTTDSPPADH